VQIGAAQYLWHPYLFPPLAHRLKARCLSKRRASHTSPKRQRVQRLN
jgi:hypothetical protein